MGKKELDIKLSKVNSSLNSAIRWVEKSGIQNFQEKIMGVSMHGMIQKEKNILLYILK